MKYRKILALCLALCLMAALSACGETTPGVYVQSVQDLAGFSAIAAGDRFAGVLVSENVTEIQKDSEKTVAELFVKAGDDVTEGQELFSYDTDQLQLTLDKQKLELEQLQATIENYKRQISDLEKERSNASSGDRLAYTIQIQTMQVDLKEAELNLTAKQNEVTKSEALLDNAVVTSPITGRVQAINENGYDNYGNPLPYISIRQAGAYRVKGTINELQRGAINVGSRIKIISRTDEALTWYGTVSLVDYENPTQGSDTDRYYGTSSNEMTSSSKYPFYVELDDSEGLMLGQHVYMELDTGSDGSTVSGVNLQSGFLCYEEDGSVYVWAEGKHGLEKRSVTLGEYNFDFDTYQVLEGLSNEDYIAFPSGNCAEGVPTTRDFSTSIDAVGNDGEGGDMNDDMNGVVDDDMNGVMDDDMNGVVDDGMNGVVDDGTETESGVEVG